MILVLLSVRLVLAAVFGIAGLTKLADPPGSRQALRDFGVPAALATPFGLLLPLAELAVAVALLPAALGPQNHCCYHPWQHPRSGSPGQPPSATAMGWAATRTASAAQA